MAAGLDIPPAELRVLEGTFHRFDTDHSNTIDVAELKQVMEELGVQMSPSDLQELLAQVTEGDALTFTQFCTLMSMWKAASRFRLFDRGNVRSLASRKTDDALRTTMLLTDSWSRCAFDALVTLVASACYIAYPIIDTHYYSDRSLAPLEAIATVVFLADVFVSALSVCSVHHELIDSPRECIRRYGVTWALPDILCVFPWSFMTGLRWLRYVRLIKMLKINFFWAPSGKMPMNRYYVSFHYHILPIIRLVVLFVLLVHTFTIGFILVKQWDDTDPVLSADGYYPYNMAMYFVVYTLCTVGFGDVSVSTTAEKAFACVVLLGTFCTNGFIVGALVNIMEKADIHEDRTIKLRRTRALLSRHDLPAELQDEILEFQDHLLVNNLNHSYQKIVEELPRQMQENILLFVKMQLIENVGYFSGVHYIVKIALAERLRNVVVIPEQYVYLVDDAQQSLFCVAHGFLESIAPNGDVERTIEPGGFFGETALFEVVPSASAVKAVTYCDLWELPNDKVRSALESFPLFRKSIAEYRASRTERPTSHPIVTPGSATVVALEQIPSFQAASFAPPPSNSSPDAPTLASPTVRLPSFVPINTELSAIPDGARGRRRASNVKPPRNIEDRMANVLERLTMCVDRMRAAGLLVD